MIRVWPLLAGRSDVIVALKMTYLTQTLQRAAPAYFHLELEFKIKQKGTLDLAAER